MQNATTNSQNSYLNINAVWKILLKWQNNLHPQSVSLQQLVPLFSISNLDEIGNPRSVLESAHQDDSKTPPGSQN